MWQKNYRSENKLRNQFVKLKSTQLKSQKLLKGFLQFRKKKTTYLPPDADDDFKHFRFKSRRALFEPFQKKFEDQIARRLIIHSMKLIKNRDSYLF